MPTKRPSEQLGTSETPADRAEESLRATADRVFTAEGLEMLDCLAVIMAIRKGQQSILTYEEREAHEAATKAALGKSLSGRSPAEPTADSRTRDQELDPNAVERMMLQDIALGLLPDFDGSAATALGIPREKLAIRRALAIAAGLNPKILADALGAAVSTLYAYADAERPNRPGPILLYRAAHFFELLGTEFQNTAGWLREIARETPPAKRGRRQKLEAQTEQRSDKSK